MTQNLRNLTFELFKSYGISPKRGLGQSILVDLPTHKKLVAAAEISPEDHVLEIGAGLGFLTEVLLQTQCKVTGIEIDKTLIPILHDRLQSFPKLTLVQGDATQLPFPEGITKVVSNLPYKQVSLLLRRILTELSQNVSVLLVQQEIAEKLQAKPGTPQYGYLSILSQLFTFVEPLFRVPPRCFIPPPKVVSTAVRLSHHPPLVKRTDLSQFLSLTRALFLYKRKLVRSALRYASRTLFESKLSTSKLLQCPFGNQRVFQLSIREFTHLSAWVSENLGEHNDPLIDSY